MSTFHRSYTTECAGLTVQYELSCPSSSIEKQQAVETEDQVIANFEASYAEMLSKVDRLTCQGDLLDYSMAVFSGLLSGLLDMFLVGEWNFANAKAISNEEINRKVHSFAMKHGLQDWVDKKNSNPHTKTHYDSDRLEVAVQFLEEKFPLPGDNTWHGQGIHVSSQTHHLDDFKHHPTLIGLICTILEQYTKTSVYHDRFGGVHRLPLAVDENGLLEGKTPEGKLAAGIINWCFDVARQRYGHLMSDMAGSKSTAGGGMGLPGGLLSTLRELASLPGFRDTNFALKLTNAYQNGIGAGENQADLGIFNVLFEGSSSKFDLRTEGAIKHELKRQAIPVAINEITTRTLYFIRHFTTELKSTGDLALLDWKRVLPFENRTIIRMITISFSTLEVVDLLDAATRSAIKSGGNPIVFASQFVLCVNFVGVGRFVVAGSTDLLMGVQKSRLELALAHAEVGFAALEMKRTTAQIDTAAQSRHILLEHLQTQHTPFPLEANTVKQTTNIFDSSRFSPQDARQAVEELFTTQVQEFTALKNRPWYKNFLQALTFYSGDRLAVVKDIRSLAALQKLFLQIYCEQYLTLNQDFRILLDQVMTNQQNLNCLDQDVRDLYCSCVLRLEPQNDPAELSPVAKQLLLQCLAAHRASASHLQDVQAYRLSLASHVGQFIPRSTFDPQQLDHLTSQESHMIYRCMLEVNLVDETDPKSADAIILNHLSVSKSAQAELEKSMEKEIAVFGPDYLKIKYKEMPPAYTEADFVFALDAPETSILSTEMKSTPVYTWENAPAPDAPLEEVCLATPIHIRPGEVLRYAHKKILMQAIVHCEGRLELDSCVVYYNLTDKSDEIKVDKEGSLYLTGCTFVNQGSDDHFFLDAEESAKSVTLVGCLFCDCLYFLRSAGDVALDHCKIVNPGLYFLYVSKNLTLADCEVELSETVPYPPQHFEPLSFDALDSSIFNSQIAPICCALGTRMENCEVNGQSKDYQVIDFSEEQKALPYSVFFLQAGSSRILNSRFFHVCRIFTFSTLQHKSKDQCLIKDCFFYHCAGITISGLCPQRVEDCAFQVCTNAMNGGPDSCIENCRFENCYDNVISSGYLGGIRVNFCLFSDWHETTQKPNSMLLFSRSRSKKSQTSKVYKCTFSSARAHHSFLIEGNISGKIDGLVAEVTECSCEDCKTQRSDGLLICENSRYLNLLKRMKIVQVIRKSGCRGC